MNERVLGFVAGGVALLALVGVLFASWQAQQSYERLSGQILEMRAEVDAMKAVGGSDIEARLAALEEAVANPVFVPLAPEPAVPLNQTGTFSSNAPAGAAPPASTAAAAPSGAPATDCIPSGLRFVATPNEPFPICEQAETVELLAIGPGEITLAGGMRAVEGGTVPVGTCMMSVISADVAGFAELQVNC